MEIVLTEDDLAAIIAETARPPRPLGPPGSSLDTAPDTAWDGSGDPAPQDRGPTSSMELPGPYAPIADTVWREGVAHPGALDEAIRRILEATSLRPQRPTEEDEEE